MPRPNPQSVLAQKEIDLRPSTKAALKLYATGAAKTITEAARAMGMTPGSVYAAHASKTGRELMTRLEADVDERAIDTAKLISMLSVKAVVKLDALLSAGSEAIQLAAAKDLLDRNPATSKTQKVAVEGFSIGEQDAQRLAEALVEASGVRQRMGDSGKKDLLAIAGGGVEVVSVPASPKIEGL